MRKLIVAASLCVFIVSSVATARVIRDDIDIDFVTIGNPGNAGDTRPEANPTGCGNVSYEYQIGKYEITANQCQTAADAGGFGGGSGSGDMPVYNVKWFDAARFCNYLTTGNKNVGVYTISGSSIQIMDHQSAASTYGVAYFLPTEDEWYKAAYYKPDSSGYSNFANGKNVAPIAGIETNYNNPVYGDYWAVGSGEMEQNGTFDMMGNRGEWTETPYTFINIRGRLVTNRIIRGGNIHSSADYLISSKQLHTSPSAQNQIGFRIASIPEPTTLLLFGIGGLFLRHRPKQISRKRHS